MATRIIYQVLKQQAGGWMALAKDETGRLITQQINIANLNDAVEAVKIHAASNVTNIFGVSFDVRGEE